MAFTGKPARYTDIGVVWYPESADPMAKSGYYVEYSSDGFSRSKWKPTYDQAMAHARYLRSNGGVGGVGNGVPLRKRGQPNEDRRYDPDELMPLAAEEVWRRPGAALDMYRRGTVQPKMPMAQAVAYLERLSDIFEPITEDDLTEFVIAYLKFDGDTPLGKDFFMSDIMKGVRDTGFHDQQLVGMKDDTWAFLHIRSNYVRADMYELSIFAQMRFEALVAQYRRTAA